MFLLIRRIDSASSSTTCFTFHDVSINTVVPLESVNRQTSLHSTMFLLIPIASGHRRKRSHFTFHDVSINTIIMIDMCYFLLYALHSTMFLLIRRGISADDREVTTLHSTMFLLILSLPPFFLYLD